MGKKCATCKQEKEVSEFHKDKSSLDGYKYSCKLCRKKESSDWYSTNKERLSVYYKKKYVQNKSILSERIKMWKIENPAKRREHKARRRAMELNATPKWADLEAIKRIYKIAHIMSQLGTKKYHVDHIIPLQGNNVCGFHIETNLQIIEASENLRKGNRY